MNFATSVRVPHVRSRLDPVEAMMSDCEVKDERGRREVIVLSARQDHLILHLHVTTFVSDSSRLFVNLYAVAKGREERSELLQGKRALSMYTSTEGNRGVTFYSTTVKRGKGRGKTKNGSSSAYHQKARVTFDASKARQARECFQFQIPPFVFITTAFLTLAALRLYI